ncbi:MAG: hypothetical protein Q9217_003656 [Psora testacea]
MSPPTSPAISQASTIVGLESSMTLDDLKSLKRRAHEPVKRTTTARDILIFLITFRIVNALSIKTFFQPDEFFQSLEPAWAIAFGANSGAWITWEWKNHLRSAIHPVLFAIIYRITAGLSWIFCLSPTLHSDLLIAAPKIAQAVCAGLGDYYTWKLGERIYEPGSNEAWAALALTVSSPWQWFCSARTLSNCLETTLTIIALNYWPWQWSLDQRVVNTMDEVFSSEEQAEEDYAHIGEGSPRISDHFEESPKSEPPILKFVKHTIDWRKPLHRCLLLAASACILRPTNLLIWICVAYFVLFRTRTYGQFLETRWVESPVWVHITSLELFPATAKERKALLREGILCGSLILVTSTLIDLFYYRQLTFPPLRFLYFNIAQSLAIFYGRNRWDYYLTEGLPLLLTTFLPFGVLGIYHGLSPPSNNPPFTNNSTRTQTIKYQLAATSIIVPLILSLISHKEVRFIYPLLPLLHLLAASPFTAFFLPAISPAISRRSPYNMKRFLLGLILLINAAIALLTTTSHQTAPLSVMTYLRHQHTTHYLTQPPPSTLPPAPSTMTVGFLMPCHSTPWRSHLVFRSIKAWALTCEPPINMNQTARATYVDEADRFYAAPKSFLATTLGTPPPPRSRQSQSSWFFFFSWFTRSSNSAYASSSSSSSSTGKAKHGFGREELIEADAWDGRPGKKSWPEYLVFFAEKEGVLAEVLRGRGAM